nr:hypothetical protein [Burkholderiaceae bacterium]
PWELSEVSADWIEDALQDQPEETALSVAPRVTFESREGYPFSTLEQTQIFHDLVDCARRHYENTGRYLQVWGELGEIYAEIKFGLRRHATHHAGSDGTIGDKLVEVKTISPEKAGMQVLIKRQGDFEQLLIVRIDRDFHFQSKLVDRSDLSGTDGKFLKGTFRD